MGTPWPARPRALSIEAMENRHLVTKLRPGLMGVTLRCLDKLRDSGIEACIAPPKKEKDSSVTFIIKLNSKKTIDEILLARSSAILKEVAAERAAAEKLKFVVNQTTIYIRK